MQHCHRVGPTGFPGVSEDRLGGMGIAGSGERGPDRGFGRDRDCRDAIGVSGDAVTTAQNQR